MTNGTKGARPQSALTRQKDAEHALWAGVEEIVAVATAAADGHAAALLTLEGQAEVLGRHCQEVEDRTTALAAARADATEQLADAFALAGLGLPIADDARDNLAARLEELTRAEAAAQSDHARAGLAQATLDGRIAQVREAEQIERERAASAHHAALETQRARLVRRIKSARVAYLQALADGGQFNARHELLPPARPVFPPPSPPPVRPISARGDDVEAFPYVAESLLAPPINYDPSWVDTLAVTVAAQEALDDKRDAP